MLQFVLWGLDDDDEFLAHLWPNLDRKLLLKLLGDRVLDEPAAEVVFRVLDDGSIFVGEWELVSVVLSKDLITTELLLF